MAFVCFVSILICPYKLVSDNSSFNTILQEICLFISCMYKLTHKNLYSCVFELLNKSEMWVVIQGLGTKLRKTTKTKFEKVVKIHFHLTILSSEVNKYRFLSSHASNCSKVECACNMFRGWWQVTKTVLGRKESSSVTSYTLPLVEMNKYIHNLCNCITYPEQFCLASLTWNIHQHELICSCLIYTTKQIIMFFPLQTRHLHLQQPVCSNGTICLTCGNIISGKEGHACSLKQ